MPIALRPYLLLVLAVVAFRRMAEAQDLHFSQFQAASQLVNPAAALTFAGDQRYAAQYRSQWLAVPVPYQTVAITYAQRQKSSLATASGWTWGMGLHYDEAGDAQLTQLAVQLYGGYRRTWDERNTLAIGASGQVGQRRFDAGALTFDAQYIDGTFRPQAPTGEDFTQFAHGYWDLGLGASWTTRLSDRLRFNLGLGAWHLNRPNYSFFAADAARLPIKTLLHLDGVIPLGEQLELQPSALFAMQGASYERLIGTYVRYVMVATPARRRAVLLGTWYRFNDAAIVAVAMEYDYWEVGLSYDVNTSAFGVATAGRGALELSVGYRVFRVGAPAPLPSCEVF